MAALLPMSRRSGDRGGTRVIWIGVHTSEGTSYSARGLRDATWWEQGSSHAVCDDIELLDHNDGCVHPDRYAWTLRNGNKKSVNIEQVAYAKWSREEWLNNHMPMLRNTARWIADMATRFDIPITYIGTQGVRDNRTGVIEHNDYSDGTGDGDHWDCGPGYPIDVVIDLAREFAGQTPATPTTPEDDMPAYPAWSKADRDKMLADIRDYAVENAAGPVPGGDTNSFKDLIWRVARIEANVDKILASLSSAPDPQ